MHSTLERNWWAFVIRGVLAILFGVIALFAPRVTMLSLLIVFAAYAVMDGVFAIVSAVRAANRGGRWGWLAFEGITGIVAGIVAVTWPHITLVVFIMLIAFWALANGIFLIAAAFKADADHGRWWMVLGGVASMLYGVLLLVAPMMGLFVLTWWIGAYAIVFGIAMVATAFRLRDRFKAAGAIAHPA